VQFVFKTNIGDFSMCLFFFEHELHELHECRLMVNALGVIESPECLTTSFVKFVLFVFKKKYW